MSPEEYAVTQKIKERAFKPYWDKFESGIYVDVATGEPSFIKDSLSLVVAGLVHPTISPDVATYKEDKSYNTYDMSAERWS